MKKLLMQITVLRKTLITLLCKLHLGKDFTPLDLVPDEFGCAEAVTTLLRQAGAIDRVIPGTWTLWQYLNQSRNWAVTQDPKEGDIIISPTGTSRLGIKRPFVGHVGIVGPKGMVYANNSDNGKWSTLYDLGTWRKRYHDTGGYPVYYYTYVSVL